MESTRIVIFASTNYFQWKSNIEDLVISKGLYRITLGTKIAPAYVEKQDKWDTKSDSAHSLIGISISLDLIFHPEGLDSPIEAWEKLNSIFGLKKEIQTYYLENELLTLDPSNFSSTEYFVSKFRTLRLLLEGCKGRKIDDGLIYRILAKFVLVYSIFVSAFHSTREALLFARATYKDASFDFIYDSLIKE